MDFFSLKFEETCFIKFLFKNCDETICKTPIQETFHAAYWALERGSKTAIFERNVGFFLDFGFFFVIVN